MKTASKQLQESLFQHVFYSASLEMPVNLRVAFPQLQRHQLTNVSDASPLLLWWHLTPGISVAEQFRALRCNFPQALVIAMSDLPHDLEALAVFSVQAKAYCNTHAGVEVLQNIAHVVESGGMWIGESIMNRLLGLNSPSTLDQRVGIDQENRTAEDWDSQLTLREREVASAVGSGATNRQIADQMGITERTVKAHVGSVLEKLKLKNRLQLALLVKDR